MLSDANLALAAKELNEARDGMKDKADDEVFAFDLTVEQRAEVYRKRKEEKDNQLLLKKAEALMELQAQLDADAEARRTRVAARADHGVPEISARGQREGMKRHNEMRSILYARVESIPGVETIPKTNKQKDRVTDTIAKARSQVSTDVNFHHRPLSNVEKSLYDNPLAKPAGF